MTFNKDDVFFKISLKLDKFYPLVRLVNSQDLLQEKDLIPYFEADLIKDILKLQNEFYQSGKLRSCGNPFFVHSLRCIIWVSALKLNGNVASLVLFHDYVEDFSTKLTDLSKLFNSVPKNIRDDVNFLTNKYKLLIRSLDFSKDLQLQLNAFSSNNFLSVVISRLFSSLSGNEDNLQSFFLDNYYNFYLLDIIDFVFQSKNYSLLIAKFIDRLDNTLTDFPSKFGVIVKLYKKNYSLLELSKNIVLESNNITLKLLYIILYSRSVNQASFLKEIYSSMFEKRGDFYGHQFMKLTEILAFEEGRLNEFEDVVSILLNDDEVIRFIES